MQKCCYKCKSFWSEFKETSIELVILVVFRFGFEGGIWGMIAPFPGHCILVVFLSTQLSRKSAILVSLREAVCSQKTVGSTLRRTRIKFD